MNEIIRLEKVVIEKLYRLSRDDSELTKDYNKYIIEESEEYENDEKAL